MKETSSMISLTVMAERFSLMESIMKASLMKEKLMVKAYSRISVGANTKVLGSMTNKKGLEKRSGIMELKHTKENLLMARKMAEVGSSGVMVPTTREILLMACSTVTALTTSTNKKKLSEGSL